MKSSKNVRIVVAALVGVVVLAGVGWAAARQIKSPAQVAADTAAPKASPISVPVQRRSLATEVIVRGTVRYGSPQVVALPTSSLKTSSQLVSQVPKPGAKLGERAVAMTVSGRPVFVLQGETPMHRDLGPGDEGKDVRQLERALARAGLEPGTVDGRYDAQTGAAVAQLYRRSDATPFGVTESQADKLSTAAAAAGSAIDHLLQMRLALRTAARGASKADVNQAQIDAATAAEALTPARLAHTTARNRVGATRDALLIAGRQQSEGDPAAARDISTAEADVTGRRSSVVDAAAAQGDAQRALDTAPADTPAVELVALRDALRRAIERVGFARADLAAAERTLRSSHDAQRVALAKLADESRRAAREVTLALAETRHAREALIALERKRKLAVDRARILRAPADTRLEQEIVAASAAEVGRTRAELARLAARIGVQVPADEVLFFATTPVRVDAVTAKRGSSAAGDLLTVTNSRLAIDSDLSVGDAKLVRRGMRVRVEEQDQRIDLVGRVNLVADKTGTNNVDPGRTYLEVAPGSAPPALVGASVKLSIAVQSTQGKVLAVPISALSVGADGKSRVQLDLGAGKRRVVLVNPGLAAQGFVEVTSKQPGALKEGDRVVVGSGAASAAKAPTGAAVPATTAGASTTASGTSTTPTGTSTTPAGTSTTPGSAPSSAGSGAGAPAATTPDPPATTPDPPGGAGAQNPGAGAPATPGGTRGP